MFIRFARNEIRDLGNERIAGAALDGKRLVTWGDRILVWDLPGGGMQHVQGFGVGHGFLDLDRPNRAGAGYTYFCRVIITAIAI